MGLNSTIYAAAPFTLESTKYDNLNDYLYDHHVSMLADWRKNYPLHDWLLEKYGGGSTYELNLELNEEILDRIERVVGNHEDNWEVFFKNPLGGIRSTETYRHDIGRKTIDVIRAAKSWIKAGFVVYYIAS